MTAPAAPAVPADRWPGFANVRDLAGVRTRTGPVQPSRLVRSAAPAGEREQLRRVLRERGVSRVVDLRLDDEAARDDQGLGDAPERVASSLVDLRSPHPYDPDVERTLEQRNRGALVRHGRTVVEAVRRVVDAPPGTVLVHCAAGKDRTGLLVALVLSALGAPDDDVAADYARSADELRDHFARELARLTDPVERERLAAVQHSDAATMHAFLHHLRDGYGGAAAYLRRHGLTDDELDRLANRLTQGA